MGDVQHRHEKNQQIPCTDCGKSFYPFRKRKSGWNVKPFKNCLACWRAKTKQHNSVEKYDDKCETLQQSSLEHLQISAIAKGTSVVLDRAIFQKKGLRKAKVTDHPRLLFTLRHSICGRSARIDGVADSGTMSNLWGYKEFKAAGFGEEDLSPVSVKLRAANKNPISVLGAFVAVFEGVPPKNGIISGRGTVYVSDTVSEFFLSYDTILDLGVVSNKFPAVCSPGNVLV